MRKSFPLIGLIGLVVALTAFAAGCVEGESSQPELLTYDAELNPNGQMCGGIAGFQCPEGQRCLIVDDYADAAGVCVGKKQWQDCSTVRCLQPICPEGFEPLATGKGCCDYICRATPNDGNGGDDLQEGQCRTAADCEGLVHIMCVGSWSCDNGWCSYTCDSTTIQ